jgi:hypothetical protein
LFRIRNFQFVKKRNEGGLKMVTNPNNKRTDEKNNKTKGRNEIIKKNKYDGWRLHHFLFADFHCQMLINSKIAI